ncbi:MAG: hypothetical protein D3926_06210 [Desulfobacteraceae bacterium]|nr:MAG: hypothetical protein D3926_06210 [Desulfobacteraceae bacterium]
MKNGQSQFSEQGQIPDQYYLQPGYILVPDKSVSISTVIGSGVCVCIFDRKNRCGGMNHFQFPLMTVKGKTTPMYGNVATIALVKLMLARETKKKALEAQIFGGAFHSGISDKDVGSENIEIARRVLKKAGITIISEDVGGEKGRKIVFNTHTNEIAVLKVDSLRNVDWYPYA